VPHVLKQKKIIINYTHGIRIQINTTNEGNDLEGREEGGDVDFVHELDVVAAVVRVELAERHARQDAET